MKDQGNNLLNIHIGKIPLVFILFPPIGLIFLYKYLYKILTKKSKEKKYE